MAKRQLRLLLWLAPFLYLNLLVIATIRTTVSSSNPIETAVRQALGSSVFGQTAIAAAWAAFGPGPFRWRFPLSLLWVALVSGAMGVNGLLYDGWREALVIGGLVLLCQWLLLLLPLWAVAIGFKVQLRHIGETDAAANQTQFGIRELMIVTFIVAVLFGVCRSAVPPVLIQDGVVEQVGPIMVFIVLAQVAITLPVMLAVLLRRRAVVGVMVSLVLIALGTIVELPLMRTISAGATSTVLEIVSLNAGTVISIIAFLFIVRLNGYSLARSQTPAKA